MSISHDDAHHETARVTFTLGGVPATAILRRDWVWECSDQALADTLTTLAAAADRSPAAGAPYRRHALEVAVTLRGVAEFPPLPAAPPNRIY